MGIIGSNIVFAMGTVGAEKSRAQLLAAAAAVGAVIYKINEGRKAAQEFAMAYRSLSRAQREVAMSADAAGKGLGDTGVIIKSVQQLAQAGVESTRELQSAIVRIAVVEGQKLGENYDQLQARIEKLTDAIAKGQTRALKQYGIDLENSEDLVLAQAEAIDKVIDRAKGLEVQIRNADEALAALNNQYDTAIGLSYEWLTRTDLVGDALVGIAGYFGDVNNTMVATDGHMLDLIYNIDTATYMIYGAIAAIRGWTEGEEKLNAALSEKIRLMLHAEEIQKTKEYGAELGKRAADLGIPLEQALIAEPAATFMTPGQMLGGGKGLKKKKGGGGGGAMGLQEYLSALNEARLLEQEIAYLRSGVMMGEGLGTSQLGIGSMEFTGAEVLEAEAEFQAMVNAELRERVDYERELNETKQERAGLLSQLAGIDPDHMTLEEKHELWDFEREQMEERRIYEQERLEYLSEELTFAEQFGEAWTNALDKVTVAESAAMTTMSLLHGTTEHFLAALIKGSPLSAKALAKLVAALAFKEAVYWTAQGLAKEGVAIYNFVSPYGDKSEGAAAQAAAGQYFAAAAMFGTISAAMGAAGRGGGGGGGGKSAGAGGGYGGGGYGGGWQGGQAPQVSVEFKVEGSIQHLWDTLVEGVTIRVSDQQRTGSYNHYPGAR